MNTLIVIGFAVLVIAYLIVLWRMIASLGRKR